MTESEASLRGPEDPEEKGWPCPQGLHVGPCGQSQVEVVIG